MRSKSKRGTKLKKTRQANEQDLDEFYKRLGAVMAFITYYSVGLPDRYSDDEKKSKPHQLHMMALGLKYMVQESLMVDVFANSVRAVKVVPDPLDVNSLTLHATKKTANRTKNCWDRYVVRVDEAWKRAKKLALAAVSARLEERLNELYCKYTQPPPPLQPTKFTTVASIASIATITLLSGTRENEQTFVKGEWGSILKTCRVKQPHYVTLFALDLQSIANVFRLVRALSLSLFLNTHQYSLFLSFSLFK
jgi:hypothetical protein